MIWLKLRRRLLLLLLVLSAAGAGFYFLTLVDNKAGIVECTDCDTGNILHANVRSVLKENSVDVPHESSEIDERDGYLVRWDNSLHKTDSNNSAQGGKESPGAAEVAGEEPSPQPQQIQERKQQQQQKVTSDNVSYKLRQNMMVCKAPLLSDDGFVRNCITNDVIGRVPATLKTLSLRPPKGIPVETSDDRRQSFQKVFRSRAWGHDWDVQYKGLNASGMGATLQWTQEAVAGLHSIINQLKQFLGVSRVRLLDVPCGDMAWMSRFLKTRDDIDYTGIDIVPDLIEHHRQTFKAYPWKFNLQDVIRSPLTETYDLILCRTLLQHLYYNDILKLLAHVSASGSGFLLVTSFSKHSKNEELVINSENPGRFRYLNLELFPVSLVPPLCMIRDGPPDVYAGWDHFLGLWKLPLRKVRRCKEPSTFEFHGTHQKLYSCVNWSLNNSN